MKHYLKLLISREGKELLGKKASNLSVLVLVLLATYISIAFSKGSMDYLQDKMEDPFTNWVNISKNTDDNQISNEEFNAFRDSLYLESNMQFFDYSAVLVSQYSHYTMVGDKGKNDYLSARFFEHLNSKLIRKVLEPSNVVKGCIVDTTLLCDQTMGVIISLNAVRRLGYSANRLPAYVHFLAHNEGADSLGVDFLTEDFVPIALPVLAVVYRLPNNVQMISGNFLYEQLRNGGDTNPFHIPSHSEDYLRQLSFFVAKEQTEAFKHFVTSLIPDSLSSSLQIYEDAGENYSTMRTWKAGAIEKIDFGDASTPLSIYQDIAKQIAKEFPDLTSVCQVYCLDTKAVPTPRSMFLSVEFNSLDHIAEFETYAKSHKIQLEMEQVHSKQNFNAVTTMAKILSAAMVIFSIVCIIMFLVNMLQGYFQKVKRNIGTFKAFGMNGRELILSYVFLLILIVSSAVLLALLLTYGIQCILPCLGIEKEGFNYLSLWNATTYVATLVILFSTIITVIAVMVKLLSQTPGDLIYDRN